MKTSLVLETENKTNNAMRLSLCWIVTSVIALFSGLMMVLVFCHFLIVPHMRTKDYVTTDCIIDDIAVIPDVTNISCADLSSDMTPLLYADTSNCQVTLSKMSSSQSLQFSSNEEQIRNSHCVQVRVRYKAEDGFERKALLQTQPLEQHKNNEGTNIFEKVSTSNYLLTSVTLLCLYFKGICTM